MFGHASRPRIQIRGLSGVYGSYYGASACRRKIVFSAHFEGQGQPDGARRG